MQMPQAKPECFWWRVTLAVRSPCRSLTGCRADRDPEHFKTSAAGGRLAIEHLADGSEWLIRSSEGVYSYSAVMAVADEAWDLPPSVVDDGLHPVILQQSNAQLWVVSTANTRASGLMLGRRAAAVAELDEPGSSLWIEWSAPPDADIADSDVWRAACPRWSDEIGERYEDLYNSAMARRPSDPVADDPVKAFSAQYVNQWPSSVEPVPSAANHLSTRHSGRRPRRTSSRSAPTCSVSTRRPTAAPHSPSSPTPPTTVCTCSARRTSAADAFDAARLCGNYVSRLLVPQTLAGDPALGGFDVDAVSTSDLPAALLLWRELLAAGRLCHFLPAEYGPCQLTVQLSMARVNVTASGLALITGPRCDALRAALWTVHSLQMDPVLQAVVW